jgi:hypothetical protein
MSTNLLISQLHSQPKLTCTAPLGSHREVILWLFHNSQSSVSPWSRACADLCVPCTLYKSNCLFQKQTPELSAKGLPRRPSRSRYLMIPCCTGRRDCWQKTGHALTHSIKRTTQPGATGSDLGNLGNISSLERDLLSSKSQLSGYIQPLANPTALLTKRPHDSRQRMRPSKYTTRRRLLINERERLHYRRKLYQTQVPSDSSSCPQHLGSFQYTSRCATKLAIADECRVRGHTCVQPIGLNEYVCY